MRNLRQTHGQFSLATLIVFTIIVAVIAGQTTSYVAGRAIGSIVAVAAIVGFVVGLTKSVNQAVWFSLAAIGLTWAFLLAGLLLSKLGI